MLIEEGEKKGETDKEEVEREGGWGGRESYIIICIHNT